MLQLSNSQKKILANKEQLDQTLAKMTHPIVFTNGCFDILHRGHVAYLEQAAGLGATLIVGVNSDVSVKRLEKDSARPFNTLADRMAVLAGLASVNWITPFDEDTPQQLIERVRPDVLVKGGDWPIADIVGADFVQSCGGEVRSIPIRYPCSTTKLIEKIQNSST